jgi:DNA invertase Pin-like site-specific DNA recombinase
VTAAIYARVSTSEQTSESQVESLRLYCLSRGLGEPAVFRDDGISGVRDNRPQLDALRERIRRGEVSAVVVTKIDRLGRSVGMVLRFWDEAEAAGVRVVVTEQGIDTSTPAGRLMRTMLAAVAEFERELILERTALGIARARAAGKRFGRPPKYSDADREEILRTISNGDSSRVVSSALKIPAGTVRWIWREARAETPPRPGLPRVLRDT